MKLVLASVSPRRSEILKLLGYSFSVRPSDCDETLLGTETPEEAVKSLSLKKAEACKIAEDEIALGADTIVVLEDKILGKPKDENDAGEMLSLLSGKTHRVYTGVTLISKNKTLTFADYASVTFKTLSQKDIETYIKTGEPFGKAGAYAIQGIGKSLVEKSSGDFFTIVGLPSIKTIEALTSFGIFKEE